MPQVVVVTDSSACVAPTWRAHPSLRMLPLSVMVTDGRFDDGDGAGPAVSTALAAGEPVETIAPSPVDYLRVLDSEPADAVVVTPASGIAVMHRNAVLAARLCGGTAMVVDSTTAGPSHGLCVAAGLRAADAGGSVEQVAAAVRSAAGCARLVAMAPDLARVGAAVQPEWPQPPAPAAATRAASQLPTAPSQLPTAPSQLPTAPSQLPTVPSQLPAGGWRPPPGGREHPAVFRFHDGVPVPVGAASGADPFATLAAAWRAEGGPHATDTVVFHAYDEDTARALWARLAAEGMPGEGDVAVVPITPAMAVHTGTGCVGVAWLQPTA